MIHIDIHISFFVNKKQSRYYLNEIIFNHYNKIRIKLMYKVKITFTILGSDQLISKNLSEKYFNKFQDIYIEYDQGSINYDDRKQVLSMLDNKINTGMKNSRNKNPDIILWIGSNDYICSDFFDQMIKYYNSEKPQIYGITSFNNGNNGVLMTEFNSITNRLAYNKSFWWSGDYNNNINHYSGGCLGINRHLYLMYPKILEEWMSCEVLDEQKCLQIKDIDYLVSKECFYFNIKSDLDLNSLDKLSKVFINNTINFNNFSIDLQNKINNEIYNFNMIAQEIGKSNIIS